MTRNDRRLRRKKPLGIGVFFVFLLVLFNILGLLATIFVATPLGKMFLFDVEGGIRGTLNSYIVPRVQTWLLDAFNLSHTVFGMGEVQTAYVYLAALFEALMLAGLFFYFPFFVMGHNRIVNKKGKKWKMALQIVDIFLLLAILTLGILFLFTRHPFRGEKLDFLDKSLYKPFFALFEEGKILSIFGIKYRGLVNPELSGAVFSVTGIFVLSFILNIIGLIGKNQYYSVTDEQGEQSAAPNAFPNGMPAYIPVAVPYAQPQMGYGYRVTPIPSAEHFIVQQPPVRPMEGNIPPMSAPTGGSRVEPVIPVPTAERPVPTAPVVPQPEIIHEQPTPTELKTQPVPIPEVTEEVFVMDKDKSEAEPVKATAVPEPTPEITEETIPVPAPKAEVEEKPAEAKVGEKKPERVWFQPTCREVSILNALGPILPSHDIALPTLRETDIPAVLSGLEPFQPVPVIDLPEEEKECEEAEEKATDIQANNVPLDYLPGIDDHILSPWEENEPKKEDVTEVAKPAVEPEVPVETKEAEPEETIASKAEEVPEAKEEEKVEEKAEKAPAPAVEETAEEEAPATPIVATILPDVEEVYVDEKPEEKAEEKEEAVEEKVEEERAPETEEAPAEVEEAPKAEEEKVEEKKATILAINEIEADGKRLQEEDHPDNEIATGSSRLEHKVIINKNDLTKKEKTTLDEGWKIPGFVETPIEKKPVVEKVIEKVVVVEKKVEEAPAPAPTPAPVEEENELEQEKKRKFTLVDPLQHAKEEKKVEEEKKLEAISGPLHQIRERKRDIQLVEPTKVKFDLKAYQIKTYQGDLTPEEAFVKGVTKVQPKVNPIFANQANDDSWKQKKIDEENRKTGFFNVSQGKIVKPTRPISQKPSNVKITSIRDLAKARKAQSDEGKDDKEEK